MRSHVETERIKQGFRNALAAKREGMRAGAEADAMAEIGSQRNKDTRPQPSEGGVDHD